MRDPAIIAAKLHSARLAAQEAMSGKDMARAVHRSTPGCTRRCKLCDIRCAILVGEAYDLESELADAIAAGPSMQHSGRFYIATEGRC